MEDVVHGVQVHVNRAESINLKLSKTYIMSPFQELQELFLLSYENGPGACYWCTQLKVTHNLALVSLFKIRSR